MINYPIIQEDGRYFIRDEHEKIIAELSYSTFKQGRVISINSSRVDPLWRGQGLAGKLLNKAVLDAVDKGQLIKPVCPFAKAVFLKNTDYQKYEYKND
ncbi:GNAT family N-acetyltransferase [Oenococcus sicerae]|uniref:GNAT family N-acetyltransferase n=1 Tax=Oenococcus sicerae TaxID=2203724 RepID=UPI0010B45981|nr:hypothetical protein OAL24_00224 [Oenococcus sicerae]